MACGRCTHVCERYSFRLPTDRTNAGLPIHGTRRVPPVTSCRRCALRLERYIGDGCSRHCSSGIRLTRRGRCRRPRCADPPQQPAADAGAGRDRRHAARVVPQELHGPVTLFSEISRRRMGLARGVRSGRSGISAREVRPARHSRHRRRCAPGASVRGEVPRPDVSRACPSFILRWHETGWNGVALPADVVGNTENHDPTPTLQLALRLHPDAERIVVVTRRRPTGSALGQRVRAAVERLGRVPKSNISPVFRPRRCCVGLAALSEGHDGVHARLFHSTAPAK